MKKNILVIGGSGFLGSHVSDALTESGFNVTIYDNKNSKWIQNKQKFILGDILDQKIVQKNFSYNADENKFKFKEYQDKIEKNLIDTIIEDVIIHLTY